MTGNVSSKGLHMADLASPSWWDEQIKLGLQKRYRKGREDSWIRIRKYYEHHYTNQLDPHFNLIYMLVSTLIPSLVFQNPHVVNKARRPQFNYWAGFFDGIDNWLIDEMEFKEVAEDAVLEAFLYNMAAIEFGYDFPEDNLVTDNDGQVLFGPVKGTFDRSRKTNQPFLDLIPAEKLVFAPTTTTMKNCPWYAKFVTIPTEFLKDDKRFRNVEVTHIPEKVRAVGENEEEYHQDRGYTGLWIIHSAEKGQWGWLSSAGKWVLPMDEDPLQVDGLPIEPIIFNKGSRSIWGTPDALYVESQHVEGDECRQDGRLQRKAALIKGFYDSELLDEEEITKYLSSKAMGMIPVQVGGDKKMSEVLQLNQPHVQMEYFEYQKQLLNDAQLLTGNGPNQFGTFAPGRRTKYETQVVEERNIIRSAQRRQRIADAIGKIMSRINQMVVKHWSGNVVSKVVGVEGAVYWVQAMPSEFKELRSQLVTSVNVESLAPVSKERRKQEMMEVMQILTQMQGANVMPILQHFLSQFDWADVTSVLPSAPQNQPMSMQDFQSKQTGIQEQGNVGGMLQQNLGGLNQLLTGLPEQGAN